MSTMSTTLTLPTAAELAAAERRLAAVIRDDMVEGTIEDVCGRVFKAINVTGEGETVDVTYENIGALALFARELRDHGEHLLALARKMEEAALVDLEGMRIEGGRQMNLPTYDEHGAPTVNPRTGLVTKSAEARYFAEAVRP